MIESFVRNPVKVTVGMLLVGLFGFIGLVRMPTQLTPEVQIPTISVQTLWPTASPQEVERQIVQEQEEQLKGVEGVTKMTGEYYDSRGVITLEFPVGTDMSEALLKVQTRLAQVPQYPPNAKAPVVSTASAGDRPIAWFILKPRAPSPAEVADFQKEHPDLAAALEPARQEPNPEKKRRELLQGLAKQYPAAAALPQPIDVSEYRKFAEDFIEARLERVAGVAKSNVFGGREEEMQVIVDPQLLAARRLTIQHVREALAMHNRDTSGGDLWEDKRRYVVRTVGQFRSPRDVAGVRLGHKKPDSVVKQFGTDCIAVNAQRSVGANVLEVMKGLRKASVELNDTVLMQRGLML